VRVLLEIGVCTLLVVLEVAVVAFICEPKGFVRAVRRYVQRRRERRADRLEALPHW
jgi:hypothetical protein